MASWPVGCRWSRSAAQPHPARIDARGTAAQEAEHKTRAILSTDSGAHERYPWLSEWVATALAFLMAEIMSSSICFSPKSALRKRQN